MSKIIDLGVEKNDMKMIIFYGSLMLVASFIALFAGVKSGDHAAYASCGFAKNIRKAMFKNIQDFSFETIDKYSTAGLLTRMTTDVTNIQNAYQMILRMCFRAPMMLIVALIMCITISPKLSLLLFIAVIFLG